MTTTCTCGHLITQHSYSDNHSGCDKCFCKLNLGDLIDKLTQENADRTERNIDDMKLIAALQERIETEQQCSQLLVKQFAGERKTCHEIAVKLAECENEIESLKEEHGDLLLRVNAFKVMENNHE